MRLRTELERAPLERCRRQHILYASTGSETSILRHTMLQRVRKSIPHRAALPPRLAVGAGPVVRLRSYHDDATFGHRVPSKYQLPDCENGV